MKYMQFIADPNDDTTTMDTKAAQVNYSLSA